jgi:hypothetical protein
MVVGGPRLSFGNAVERVVGAMPCARHVLGGQA